MAEAWIRPELGPQVVEVVSELVIGGERMVVAIGPLSRFNWPASENR